MNHLLIRLAASGAVVLSLGAPTLASDGAHIGFTGPESRNIIAVDQANRFNENIRNNVGITNNNTQTARSGNVFVERNGFVGGVRSGDAINTNRTFNEVGISTPGSIHGGGFVGGTGLGTVGGPGFGPVGGFNDGRGVVAINGTGPGSNNIIKDRRITDINRNVNNTVGITNNNIQNAQSGNVKVVNNGGVHGPVSSGNAVNTNQTSNQVNIR